MSKEHSQIFWKTFITACFISDESFSLTQLLLVYNVKHKAQEHFRALLLIHQITNALHSIQFLADLNLLHVSAPGCQSSGSVSDQRNTGATR